MATKASIEQFDQGDFAEYHDRLHFFLFPNDIGTVPSGASAAQKELADKKRAGYLVSLLSKTAYTTSVFPRLVLICLRSLLTCLQRKIQCQQNASSAGKAPGPPKYLVIMCCTMLLTEC